MKKTRIVKIVVKKDAEPLVERWVVQKRVFWIFWFGVSRQAFESIFGAFGAFETQMLSCGHPTLSEAQAFEKKLKLHTPEPVITYEVEEV